MFRKHTLREIKHGKHTSHHTPSQSPTRSPSIGASTTRSSSITWCITISGRSAGSSRAALSFARIIYYINAGLCLRMQSPCLLTRIPALILMGQNGDYRFSLVVCPTYEDSADEESSPFDLPNTKPISWSWLSTLNRVNTQVRKVCLSAQTSPLFQKSGDHSATD